MKDGVCGVSFFNADEILDLVFVVVVILPCFDFFLIVCFWFACPKRVSEIT